MKYPEDFINKVIQGDCLEIMKQMPDKCVDLVLTDPPYGIGEDERSADEVGRLSWKVENRWDLTIPSKEVFTEIMRVSKNQIIWGGNYFIENGLKNSRCWLSWYKMQEFSGADMELAWTSFDMSSKTFKMSRVEFHGKEKKQHPTQKPLELMKWIIENYANKDDLIFDPFLGSGTTAVAAKQLGRKYIGIEISEKYCEISRQRLRQEVLF
mgnify:CR=1 FL=1